jgi:hypothetical protein
MITHDEAKEKALFLHGKYDEAYKTLNDYITQQEQFAKDVAKLMYYLEYKEKWTDALTESLNFYYYKVLNKIGKEE